MKILLQRVHKAAVRVSGDTVSQIGRGILIYAGIEKEDDETCIEKLAKKVSQCRLFEDEGGKMNLSIQDVGGEILVVSEFTLAADVRKGTRPSFDTAKDPETAREMMGKFSRLLKETGLTVKEGVFGAHMDVESVNDGPVTFLFE
uniref:D-aminoacyl-tRNA deacylase n=1 Tax=uncultured bacterium W4-21b TaxID=1130993 RepID=H9BWM6_9BACT|nr:D-tyrosyl-tRNA(Tyr) deacylase [uncultured bacterium W4-21b]